jgi:AraC-like DNA-binding protein
MVSIGHMTDLSFRNPRHPALGVHAMRLKELYRRTAGAEQPARLRVPVHLLALVTAGRATFTVDFATYPCRPGGLLWVRPGQFVGFPPPGVDATLVLFEPEFPYEAAAPRAAITGGTGRGGARRAAGTYWQPTGEDEEAIVDAVSQLEIDYNRIIGGDENIPLEVLRHHLAALLLRIGRLEPEGGPDVVAADNEFLARFRREIDERFSETRQVEEYARTLGCSVRTLTRASLAATGRTAKQLVDDRVALEAKRLLAESDLAVAEVGSRLGFSEPTNFGRFFTRTVGVSPGQFRADSRRAAAEAHASPAATPHAQPLAAALAKAGSSRHR